MDHQRIPFLLKYAHLFKPLLPSHNWFSKEHRAEHSVIPFHALDQQPQLIKNGEMKDYQLHGLSFLVWLWRNGMNGILGDEMGLGKTLQTLSLFTYLYEQGHKGPHLVVCPLSVLSSWVTECRRWTPHFTLVRFHGGKQERERLKKDARALRSDILITTYEQYKTEEKFFKKELKFCYVVLDEGHKVKNTDTALAIALQGIQCQFRLLLTGTPLANNLRELWALLHWLYPSLFTESSVKRFEEAFDLTMGKYEPAFIDHCRKLLELVMLRRMKLDVVKELSVPPRHETNIYLPLTPLQRFWYKRILTRLDSLEDLFGSTAASGTASQAEPSLQTPQLSLPMQEFQQSLEQTVKKEDKRYQRLMNMLMQLRKVCNHPYLIEGAEPDPYFSGPHLLHASNKLLALDKLLKVLLKDGRKALIFSQWTKTLDLLEEFLELREITFARLDGSTTRPRRTLDIKLFQQKTKSPYQVYIISTKAGGLGINLTAADHVIFMDSDWNPQVYIPFSL